MLVIPDADASTVIDGNIPAEFMTKVKAKTDELETPAILSQKTLKLKMIAKLEKLIHVRKVATTIDKAIVMYKGSARSTASRWPRYLW